MRLLGVLLTLLALATSPLAAQTSAPKILDVQIGFKPHTDDRATPTHKVGLWTPVSVRLQGGATRFDNDSLHLALECEDSEDCLTTTRWPVTLEPGAETTVVGYIKPGQTRGEVRVWLEGPEGLTIAGPTLERSTSNLGDYLYLSLGARLDELAAGLSLKEKRAAEEGKATAKPNRFALSENDPDRLPEHWFGYDGLDLVILNTTDAAFVDRLIERGRLLALRDWVARGGRLVIPLHPERTAQIATFFGDPAAKDVNPWPTLAAKNLVAVESWSGLQNKPFPARGQTPVIVTRFDAARFGKTWEVVQLEDTAAGDRPLPLIARVSHGFGSITFIAFPLDSGGFANWSGQAEFFRTLVDQFGPRYVTPEKTKDTLWGAQATISDWGAQLQRDLDNFDVPTLSFGTVAFFMLAYVLLVSAFDYFLLRRIIGKFEATWITLPLMVLGVCLGASAVVHSPADQGVRVNQIDVLDWDVRGKSLHGSTFFMVRSDAIRRWDISIGKVREPLAWFGRADDGPGGMGRAGGYRLSPKSYRFDEQDWFPRAVPFAFRATKAFAGEWESGRLNQPNYLTSDLVYHPREYPFKVSGTLVNQWPFDLDEADLFIFDRVYSLAGGLKNGELRRIEIKEIDNGILPSDWLERAGRDRPETPRGTYDPGAALKHLLFHERLDPPLKIRNHLLRRLDWSWRLRDDPRVVNKPLSSLGTQEAILVGRAKFQAGDAKTVANDPRTMVRVELAPDDAAWPGAAGRWSRDTYVRALLPLRPQP
jgi:hypothetical protein